MAGLKEALPCLRDPGTAPPSLALRDFSASELLSMDGGNGILNGGILKTSTTGTGDSFWVLSVDTDGVIEAKMLGNVGDEWVRWTDDYFNQTVTAVNNPALVPGIVSFDAAAPDYVFDVAGAPHIVTVHSDLVNTVKPRITIDPSAGPDSVNDGIAAEARSCTLPRVMTKDQF